MYQKLKLNKSLMYVQMDKVNKYIKEIEKILQTQNEIECRKDVFETLGILIQENPQRMEEIQNKFQALCVNYSKDFYKEIRWDNPKEILKSI